MRNFSRLIKIDAPKTLQTEVEFQDPFKLAFFQRNKSIFIFYFDKRLSYKAQREKVCFKRWIESFLCRRTQEVVRGDHVSEWTAIRSGVRQGSLLEISHIGQ